MARRVISGENSLQYLIPDLTDGYSKMTNGVTDLGGGTNRLFLGSIEDTAVFKKNTQPYLETYKTDISRY